MIRLNNASNISTYISGNYITIANNNPTTLIFSETDNSCPSTVTPSTVSISGALLNLTTVNVSSLLNCNPNPNITYNDTFYYEVINPKVIFERNDKNSNITFIDVTTKQTYSHTHNIPVTNNTWLQNPNIVNNNLGRIFIEKYNDLTLVWDVIGSMTLNGSFTYYTNLAEDQVINCQFRSRYLIRERQNCGGTSPVIFEAEGEEFTLLLKYYEEDNLYIKEVLINDVSKFNLCEQDPTDYLTIEVEKQFEVKYDSYNIDYVYQYLTSSSSLINTPIIDLVYNEPNRSVQGTITDLDPRQVITNVNVEFIGCQNEFIDGLLEVNLTCSGGIPLIEGDFNCNDFSEDFYRNCSETFDSTIVVENKDLLVEGVRPNILDIIQDDCTYCITIQDNTIVENPCLKGKVLYQYKTSLEGEWCDFIPPTIKEIIPLSSFKHCFCGAGIVYIRNKYKYFQEHKCGCEGEHLNHEDILFETDWYEYSSEILEYKPKVNATIVEENGCCTILEYQNEEEQFIDIIPNTLELNDYFCSDLDPRQLSNLKYILEQYNQVDSIWEIIEEVILPIDILDYDISNPIITNAVILDKYKYSIDKNLLEQGGYRVRYILSNCCSYTEEVVYLNLCDSLTIQKDCDIIKEDFTECDCYIYNFTNYSPVDTYIIEIYNTNLDTVVDTLTILPLEKLKYKFVEDGIYTLNITNNNQLSTVGKYSNPYIIPVFIFCKIDKCYTDIVKDILCSYNADCDCEDDDLVKDRFRLNKVMALYQTYMRLIEKDYYLMSRYNAIDITGRLETFKRLNKVYEQLLKFCEPCNNGFKTNCCG